MRRIVKSVLWATVLFLFVSCAAQMEEVIPTPAPEPVPPPAPAPEPAKVEVVQLQMTDNQEYVKVKIRVKGNELNTLDPSEIYLLDETSGKKYPVIRLQRIGKLAEFNVPGEKGVRHIMFWNNEGGLKAGRLVTIVVGKYQKEHILIK